MRNKMVLLFCTLFSTALAGSSDWRPVIPSHTRSSLLQQEAAIYDESPHLQYSLEQSSIPSSHHLAQQEQDQCALYKVAMNQQLYFEYVHYKIDLPDMKEFTLCAWTKFHNHSNDHPLFSYAVDGQPRGILAWIANTARSSYFMLNIDGHNIFRLNYPLRLNKWYHSCQSWNGRTGEWQIWVNDERVGRGFNNRLVGHVIKGGGIAISGQEQRQLGGGFLEGSEAPDGSGGYLGELTMLQLYGVALTAGKAHKDHKHHHAHHWEHDTSNNTPRPTTTQAPVTGRPLPQSPFLTGGQINHQVKINTGTPLQITQNGLTLRHPNILQPQTSYQPLLPPVNPDSNPAPPVTGFGSALGGLPLRTSQYFGNQIPQLSQISQIQGQSDNGFSYLESQYPTIYKREVKSADTEDADAQKSIAKREVDGDKVVHDKVTFVSSEKNEKEPSASSASFGAKIVQKRDSEKKKRGLVQLADGSILDDTFLGGNQGLDNNYFSGLASFGLELPIHKMKDEEREPAEGEVKQVMEVCDGCAEDPFEKALIMGWRSVPKKLYSGALYLPAAQTCKGF
ncbi:uncharacterized protein LOC110117176 isoform X2 [Athalia rosae]|uniref:uncharacterized protein LOC110117176 isoform X2 n=1 Tax=Athalia rosae TaxID=37344 RepID=UPI002033C9D8|nr:uncharacterized protein LOC110117176 isoform X2 [Athalia rosae]